MEKKNELEKEERTIFIVLAIIVLIAIGVLVTWYFTKDKEVDSDTKTEVVDKQKKKKTDSDTTTKDTVVTKVEESETTEEENVVDTHNAVTIVYTNVEGNKKTVEAEEVKTISVKEDTLYHYVLKEKVKFDNEVTGVVKEVYLFDETNATRGEVAQGQYTKESDSELIFNTKGKYVVVLLDENQNEFEIVIEVLDDEGFDSIVNYYQNEFDPSSLITQTYYNANLLSNLQTAINSIDKTNAFTKRDSIYEVAKLEREFTVDRDIRNNALNEITTFRDYVANIDQSKLNTTEVARVNEIIANHTNIIANANSVSLEDLQQALVEQQQLALEIDAIEQRVVSYDNLQTLIDAIDTKISDNTYQQSDYTTNSWNDLQTSLTDAKTITVDDKKEDVDTANDNLVEAEDNLATKTDAQNALSETISDVNTIYENRVRRKTVVNTTIKNKIHDANESVRLALNSANSSYGYANSHSTTPDYSDNAKTTLEGVLAAYYATMSEALDDVLANIETNGVILSEEQQAIYDSAKAGNLTNEQVISYAKELVTVTV